MTTPSTEPTNTSMTYLKVYEGSAYTDLFPVKSTPDLGSAPSKLETTDLSSTRKEYIQGLQDSDDLEFTCNYIKANYDKALKLVGKMGYFRLDYGEDGAEGQTWIKGTPYCFKTGSEADAVREFTFGITVADMSDEADLKIE